MSNNYKEIFLGKIRIGRLVENVHTGRIHFHSFLRAISCPEADAMDGDSFFDEEIAKSHVLKLLPEEVWPNVQFQ